jgi:membrane-bound lytic murein transglycosylase A
MAHDTGGAIKGATRVDVFFGFGREAEQLAGNMKQPGRVYALIPRARD